MRRRGRNDEEELERVSKNGENIELNTREGRDEERKREMERRLLEVEGAGERYNVRF